MSRGKRYRNRLGPVTDNPTQEQVDLLICDLDPDLPWNRPAVDIDIERLDQELARHRQALKRDEITRNAAAAGFTVAVIVAAVVVWVLSRYLIAW